MRIIAGLLTALVLWGWLGPVAQVSAAVTCKPECGTNSQICVPSKADPNKGECVKKNAANLNHDPGGLVPCTTNCNFCDLFALVERVVQRLFLQIVPIVATLLVALAGIIMLTSMGNQSRVAKAWDMLKNVIIGLTVMYASWIVVHAVLTILIDKKSSVYDIVFPWNDIECKLSGQPPIDNPPAPPNA